MNLSTKKKTIMKKRSFVSLKQRIVATFTVGMMLLQICIPSIAAAANLLSNESISAAMAAPTFQKSVSNSYLYQQASFDDASYIGSQNITTFRERLVAAKINLGKPTFIPIASDITIFIPTYPTGKLIGDAYVQNRYIRQQVFDLLGRHLIYAASSNTSEISQINDLYEAAFTFAKANPSINFGDGLTPAILDASTTPDMIWPERRVINNESVVVPVVYLKTSTINNNKVTKTKTEFVGAVANLGSVTLNHAELTLGANTIVKTAGNLTATKESLIASGGDVNLVVGGTLNLIGSKITSVKDVNILANEVNVKTVLVPFQDKYGSGTKLGSISSINADAGSIKIFSNSDITFEGSSATASNGAITLDAKNNISIKPVFLSSQSGSNNGTWIISSSSVNVIGSRLTSKDTMSLIAGGTITISASDLISTQGGLELLAQEGIYVLDEQNQTQISRQKIRGKTKGTSSEFNTIAIRSILNAGKGVLMDTDAGDITLRASQISSTDGTSVYARNGKVHLLITKEQSHYYLNMVKKGTWTIKTHTVEKNNETPVANAIVGGLKVEALQGVDVEYSGLVGADGKPIEDLDAQMDAYKNMPELSWMADLRNDPKVTTAWNQVKLIKINKDKTSRQLSPAAMAIIAIAVAVATGGSGAALVAGSTGATGATVVAVSNAAFTTLVTQASSSILAGNSLSQTLKSMSSDDNLKSLAISMVTAGVMEHTDLRMFSVSENVQATTINTQATAITLAKQAGQAVVNTTVRASISVAINGGNMDDFKETFKQSLASDAINFIGQNLSDKISGSTNLNDIVKYISHAGMGCLTQGLSSKLSDADFNNACVSGAGGALISDAMTAKADKLDKEIRDWVVENSSKPDKITYKNMKTKLESLRQQGANIPKLIAGIAAFAAGGNVNAAAGSAEMIAKSNLSKFVDLAKIYESQNSSNGCAIDNNFTRCSASSLEETARRRLQEEGIDDVSAESLINKAKAQGLFDKGGALRADAYANGDNFDNFPSKGSSKIGVLQEDIYGNLVEFETIGSKTFGAKVENLGASINRFKNSLTPAEERGLSIVAGVVTAGVVSTFISTTSSVVVEHALPDDVANAMAELGEKINSAIGSGIISFIEYDEVKIDNYNDVVKRNADGKEFDLKDTIDGLGWITSTIVGLPGKKGTNTTPNITNTTRKNLDSDLKKADLAKAIADNPSLLKASVNLKNAGLGELAKDLDQLKKFDKLIKSNNLGLDESGVLAILKRPSTKGQTWDKPEAVLSAIERASDSGVSGLSIDHKKFPVPGENVNGYVLKNAKKYQEEASGDAGLSFVKNGVSFDDIAPDGKLIDRKFGHGNAIFDEELNFINKTRVDSLLNQADRQIAAAGNGNKIRWEISSERGADGIKVLFAERGIPIDVVYVAQQMQVAN